MFRSDEKVFDRLFPKDLSPNEASVQIPLEQSQIGVLKDTFKQALLKYEEPHIDKDFHDYRHRLAMTQLVMTDEDYDVFGEDIAETIRRRLIELQKKMTFTEQRPIYPEVNLFAFLIYVRNNNGYCEFKNKYSGRMVRMDNGNGDSINPVTESRIKEIKGKTNKS
jgi:hypothetical protein